MAKRLSYALVGCGLFAILGWLLRLALHRHSSMPVADFATAGAALAIWIGERTGRLQPLDQLRRPITLFPEGVPGPR